MHVPKDLVDQIARGNGIVFVGAGLSQGAGLPGWEDLLRQMLDWSEKHGKELTDRDELKRYIDNGELLLVAEEMRERLGKDDFRRFMAEIFRKPGLKPTAQQTLLPQIPFVAALTSNFETLLESTYTITRGAAPHVFTHADYPELSAALRSGEFYVLKVHGTIDRIQTIVLGRNDYRDVMYANPPYRQFLTTLFSTKTVLFLGFGLTDTDLLLLLEELRATFKDYTTKHYALMCIGNIATIKQKRFEKDFGIEIIPYTPSQPDHPEVHMFLNDLLKQVIHMRDTTRASVQGPATPLEDLAAEVRAWLQAVRYELSEPQRLDDRTVEMLAALDQGTIKQRVLVRCIGGEITTGDADALDGVLDRKTPQGWLISDKRVSDRARARAAEDDVIQVFNLSEFLRQMVWGPYFDALTSLINQDRIPELYVDLACYKQEMAEEGPEINRERFSSLDAYIDSWLTERGKMHISLLGDFGAGKTWFCRHYAHRQLGRYLKDPAKERLPLLISLRTFTKALTVQQLINDALLEQFKLPFVGSAFEVFQEMNRRGKLLLILDGFDEMARQVDYQTIVDNFWELANLVDENSKVILTSRTEYFRWAEETEKILGGREHGRRTILLSPPQFEVLYIEPFSNDQIREVIKRRLGAAEGSVLAERILITRNLAEMARKPVVVELLLAVVDEVSAAVLKNPAQVYLHATNKLLLRNIDTRRTFTSTADKLYFLCELAWEMIKGNELRVHYGAIPERISLYFGDQIKDQHELDMWDYDLHNQTLLHRDAAGYYEFAHKSLAEYFVAFKFAVELGCLAPLFRETYCEGDGQPCELPIAQKDLIGLTHTFGTMALSDAQMYATLNLLREMMAEDAAGRLWEIVDETKGKMPEQVKYVGGNAATLLNRMGESFARRDLKGAVLTGAMLRRADLTDSDISGAFLDNTHLVGTCLKGVQCIDTSFRNAILINTMMEQASFEGVDFTDTDLEYVRSVFTISYSTDGLRIAGGGDPGKITIWDSKSGREILYCAGHDLSTQAVIYSPLGEFLASGGGDGYVRVWDALTGNEIWSKKLHEDFVRGLGFDPTGQWLASVGEDGRLIIWEARTGEGYLHLIKPSGLLCVSFSPNGDLLGMGSRDGTLVLWDPRIRSEIGRWQAHEQVLFVAFSADSSLLISGGVDHTDRRRRREVASIKVWEVPVWRNRLSIDFDYTGGWLHGSVSPREPYVAGKTGPSEAAIWNYQTGEQLFLLKGHYATLYTTLFSPDGHSLASSSRDGSIRVWDVQTGTCMRSIYPPKDYEGARFTNIRGLDASTCEWLRDRGAII